jgi:4-hydroxybenzoate polyprenyltransferase
MFFHILTSYWRCLRFRQRVLLLYPWPTIVGLISAVRGLPPVDVAVKTFLAMATAALAVYIFNDVQDLEEDHVSAQHGNAYHVTRPLVTGSVTIPVAMSLVVVLSIISLCISAIINHMVLTCVAAFLGLGYIYSAPPIQLKKRFFLKQLTIGLGGLIAGLAGGAAVAVLSRPVMYCGFLFFTLNVGLTPLVDLRDIDGDRRVGRNTFPVVLGPHHTILLGLATTIVTLVLTLMGYVWIGFNVIYPIMATCSLATFGVLAYHLLGRWQDPNFVERHFIKNAMPTFSVLQIGLVLGALPLF